MSTHLHHMGQMSREKEAPPAWSLVITAMCCLAFGAILKGCADDFTAPYAIEFPGNHAQIVCAEFARTPTGVRWENEWGERFSIDFMTRNEWREMHDQPDPDGLPAVCALNLMPDWDYRFVGPPAPKF